MTPEQIDAEILRRHFVAIATADYDDEGLPALPQVHDEVRDLAAWLCDPRLGDRRFTHEYRELADNPTEEQIRAALKSPEPGRKWRETDAVVVYITGHGISRPDGHRLALRATVEDAYKSTALRTAEIIGWLMDTKVRYLLLIIDTCYAGDVATGILAYPDPLPKTWVVLASAAKDEQAAPFQLTSAIREVLAELGDETTGRKYGTDRYLPVREFCGGVSDKLDGVQRLVDLGGGLQGGLHACLPNPHARPPATVRTGYRVSDLALPARDMEIHWEPRSRGVPAAPAVGWLFTGRIRLMDRLIETATTGEPGAVVVTGRAGSGKTAALARLVTLSDPEFRRKYGYELTLIPDELKPPEGAVDVAVVATGKNATDVMTQICRATGAVSDETDPRKSPEQAWDDWIGLRTEPVTIVVDALDEAGSPEELVKVLRRLCGIRPGMDGPRHRVRLIVGVRAIGNADRDETVPATRAGIPLADLVQQELRIESPAGRIQVDEAPWWDRQDLVTYVISLLRTLEDSPYREAEDGLVAAIAGIVADAAHRSFLFAYLAASQLAARDAAVDVDDSGWLASIRQGVLGLFREDLHRSLPEPGQRLQAVHLLRAVAFAFGPGLPWRKIWPLVATAVAGEEHTYGDEDIAWLLGTRLGGYLVTDRADGVTVYRLFHDDLRGILYDRWEELL